MFSLCTNAVFYCFFAAPYLIENTHCKVNKYSEEANTKFVDDINLKDLKDLETPFRMKKVNFLWAKAKNRVPELQLTELYADLKVHDKHELQLKKMKSDNTDKDGDFEAMVLKNYQTIVERFDLQDLYFGNDVPSNEKRSDTEFTDSKLQSLWKKAQMSGFSVEDLKTLKEEFWHQQMKIQELDFIKTQHNSLPDPDDNSVDGIEQMSNIKSSKKEIKDGYMRLEELVSSLPKTDPLFKDTRVHQLWVLARKTNWTEDELKSFKEELLHFENRLTKQSFYKEQLEMSAQKLENDEKDQNYVDRHRQLEEKHEVINKHVKKLHTELKSKVSKALKHVEL